MNWPACVMREIEIKVAWMREIAFILAWMHEMTWNCDKCCVIAWKRKETDFCVIAWKRKTNAWLREWTPPMGAPHTSSIEKRKRVLGFSKLERGGGVVSLASKQGLYGQENQGKHISKSGMVRESQGKWKFCRKNQGKSFQSFSCQHKFWNCWKFSPTVVENVGTFLFISEEQINIFSTMVDNLSTLLVGWWNICWKSFF